MTKDKATPRREVDQEAVLIYVVSSLFPVDQCLMVTNSNLNSLANLTAWEEVGTQEREELATIYKKNTAIMKSFMEIRMKGDERYVVIFAGCDISICCYKQKELPREMANAVKKVTNVDISNKVLSIPWMRCSFSSVGSIYEFQTEDVDIQKGTEVTIGGKSLKEIIWDAIEESFDRMGKQASAMYGPVNDNTEDEETVSSC